MGRRGARDGTRADRVGGAWHSKVMKDGLIYDWNLIGAGERPAIVMLDDETLRDGLQSPSVRTPTIDQKIEILHLIDSLGIDTADIGLPGAGPRVVRDVERLAR